MFLKNENTNNYSSRRGLGDKHKTDLFVIFKNLYFDKYKNEQNILL